MVHGCTVEIDQWIKRESWHHLIRRKTQFIILPGFYGNTERNRKTFWRWTLDVSQFLTLPSHQCSHSPFFTRSHDLISFFPLFSHFFLRFASFSNSNSQLSSPNNFPDMACSKQTQRHSKSVECRISVIQNKCLRIISEPYKGTPINALEAETFVLPILSHLMQLQAKSRYWMQSTRK